jgi:uridine kinase
LELPYQRGVEFTLNQVLGLQASGKLPIVLIDGRAASGKSQFAKDLAEAFFQVDRQAARTIHMDDLYPGWNGLAEGSVYLLTNILLPLANSRSANWQVWNWRKNHRGAEEPGNGRREFSGGTLLIVEGCGSISRLSYEHSDFQVWIDADDKDRKERFSLRDHGQFDEYFGIWSAQEDEFYEREKSKQLAQLIVQN